MKESLWQGMSLRDWFEKQCNTLRTSNMGSGQHGVWDHFVHQTCFNLLGRIAYVLNRKGVDASSSKECPHLLKNVPVSGG